MQQDYLYKSEHLNIQPRKRRGPTNKGSPQSTSIVSGSDRSSGGIVEEGEMCGTDFTTEKGGEEREYQGETGVQIPQRLEHRKKCK